MKSGGGLGCPGSQGCPGRPWSEEERSRRAGDRHAARGAGRRARRRAAALGHEVVLCPLVRIEPLGDEPVDVSGRTTGWWSRARTAPTSSRGGCGGGRGGWLRSGRRRLRRSPRTGSPSTSCLRVATQEGLLAELPRPAGRVLVAAAEGARRLLVDELGADFVPLYRTVELRPPELPQGDLAVLASGSAARALGRARARRPGRLDRPADHGGGRGGRRARRRRGGDPRRRGNRERRR